MKEKILIVTNIYSDPELRLLNNTDVCHYFVREWLKMGYDVKVIYNYTIYAKVLHFIARFFEVFIANWAVSIVNTNRQVKDKLYTIDGVKVVKLPIYKALPRTKFSQKAISNQAIKIIKSNKKDNFKPDIIIGHFHNPSLPLVNLLKNEYLSKTCIVLHGDTKNIKINHKNNYGKLIDNVDVWGYRSRTIGEEFESIYGVRPQSFICYSGVPGDFLTVPKERSFSNQINKFIYVGTLIKRKNPISLIYALDNAYPNKNFSLTYIGKGNENKKMRKLIKKLNLISNIQFLGHISREVVSKEIEASESFIMISERETFGLVYLEAMAKGCITIGSRKEGIDGVIRDGENGFLCEAGNYIELESIIRRINSLSNSEKNQISAKAISTAANLTDYKAAKKYLETVLSYRKNII